MCTYMVNEVNDKIRYVRLFILEQKKEKDKRSVYVWFVFVFVRVYVYGCVFHHHNKVNDTRRF